MKPETEWIQARADRKHADRKRHRGGGGNNLDWLKELGVLIGIASAGIEGPGTEDLPLELRAVTEGAIRWAVEVMAEASGRDPDELAAMFKEGAVTSVAVVNDLPPNATPDDIRQAAIATMTLIGDKPNDDPEDAA